MAAFLFVKLSVLRGFIKNQNNRGRTAVIRTEFEWLNIASTELARIFQPAGRNSLRIAP